MNVKRYFWDKVERIGRIWGSDRRIGDIIKGER